jgi:hypothetical protein
VEALSKLLKKGWGKHQIDGIFSTALSPRGSVSLFWLRAESFGFNRFGEVLSAGFPLIKCAPGGERLGVGPRDRS